MRHRILQAGVGPSRKTVAATPMASLAAMEEGSFQNCV